MGLVTPDFGLLFWMLVTFVTVLFVLKKFAWRPILNSLKEREDSIDEALKSADKAREEMAKLTAENEQILVEARQERDGILAEARSIKQQIIDDAKNQAKQEAEKMIEAAKQTIEKEKNAAVQDMKKSIATLSVQIAEKILQQKLAEDKQQEMLVKKYMDKVHLN